MEPWGSFERRGPDPRKLSKIKLPDDPTKDQVREYVGKIAQASRNQNSFSSDDPQVRMLTAVGPDHLDVLLESSGRPFGLDMHAIEAVRRPARPQHKELVLEHLPWNHELAKVVERGWVEDARETLVNVLRKRPEYLPEEWIEAAALLVDPATYDDLKWYLIHGGMPERTYEIIRHLPGIDLTETIEKAWEVNRHADEYRKQRAARVVARFGNVEALGEVVGTGADP